MHLPARFAAIILAFAPLFLQQRTWRHAELLLIGAILAPGKRTVTSLLRITGLSRERQFTNYHRVLNRAVWDPRAAARLLLGLLIAAFAPSGPVVLGIDDTIERRRGKRIAAKGIYRDPVRSSKSHFVKASGLRWLSLMLLAPDPVGRAHLGAAVPDRAGPLGALLPRARQAAQEADRLGAADGAAGPALAARARDRAGGRQQLCRLGVPGDAGSAWPHRHHPPAAGCGALRAGTAAPARDDRAPAHQGRAPADPGRRAGRRGHALAAGHRARLVWRGRPRRRDLLRHGRLVPCAACRVRADPLGACCAIPCTRFDPQALLCTDPAREPLQIVRWFVQRWQVEVTFREVRDHLGVETQRQWSDRAIARTTPCLLGLFSIVTLLAARLDRRARSAVCIDAWYRKPRPTFADTLAAVRRQFWREQGLLLSGRQAEARKLRPALRHGIAYALCHAA